MSSIGHPVVGDDQYDAGGDEDGDESALELSGGYAPARIALWSVTVEIPHPVTKETVRVTELPPHMLGMLGDAVDWRAAAAEGGDDDDDLKP